MISLNVEVKKQTNKQGKKKRDLKNQAFKYPEPTDGCQRGVAYGMGKIIEGFE